MSISYELAKELKDAGFPQLLDPAGAVNVGKVSGALLWDENAPARNLGDDFSCAYAPALSELIEACGGDGFHLMKNRDSWLAYQTSDLVCKDSTPEEAVASLWLALNKK